ncbi:hypothetical protein [Microcoleus sp. F4-D5]|uniref:hypothetical protein n=1 Tax=Microcoleus sp. F4-D5 TaxID=2818760 RepID=UPI002FD11BCD
MQEIPDGHFPRWGLLMLPLTLEVVWKPGLEGLKALNSRVRIYTEGLLSVNAALCTQYKDCEILVLKSFFSRLGMCEIEQKTLKTIVALEYKQNNQDSITIQLLPKMRSLNL